MQAGPAGCANVHTLAAAAQQVPYAPIESRATGAPKKSVPVAFPAEATAARHSRRANGAVFIEKRAGVNEGVANSWSGAVSEVDELTRANPFFLEEFIPDLHSAKLVVGSDCNLEGCAQVHTGTANGSIVVSLHQCRA